MATIKVYWQRRTTASQPLTTSRWRLARRGVSGSITSLTPSPRSSVTFAQWPFVKSVRSGLDADVMSRTWRSAPSPVAQRISKLSVPGGAQTMATVSQEPQSMTRMLSLMCLDTCNNAMCTPPKKTWSTGRHKNSVKRAKVVGTRNISPSFLVRGPLLQRPTRPFGLSDTKSWQYWSIMITKLNRSMRLPRPPACASCSVSHP
mmetsp:Transcript_34549/g.95152  ORF Transcript_34549/g.95152 Transcript_34549/m.95152 type:complete len:203 (+) Transcript_34549:1889-2497(+)